MAKPPPSAAASAAGGRGQAHHRTRFLLLILVAVAASASTAGYLLRGAPVAPCDAQGDPSVLATARVGGAAASPLGFMKSKLVLLVSHELSLSGGPLLLMELAFLLRQVGSQVVWITNQRPEGTNYASYGLEHKMLNHGVQILPARGQEALDTALRAELVILNTAVAGKWLDAVLKDHVPQVLPKILWWIHEMRGHYFKLEYVKHLPLVAGAMIDSHTTAEYWKNRTHDRLNIQMPQTYVVHLGNSKELTEVAEDNVARRVLHEHIRESLGVRSEDLLFAIINSVSRGKGQDLFLQAFYQSLQLIQHQKLKVPRMHAVVVGSDMNAQTKFETQLHEFVAKNGIQDRVHFINKTLAVAPYLSAIDVLVQNSQARGECFGRITIEAMAFKLPVLAIFSSLSLRVCVCTWHGRWRDHRNCFGWLNWPSAPCWEGGRHASREEHGKACEPCRGEGLHGEQGLCQSEGEVHGTPHGRPYRRGVEGSSAEIAAAFPFLSFVTARIQWHRCVDISCASMLIRILARLNPNTESTVRSLLPVPLTSVVIRGCCLLT